MLLRLGLLLWGCWLTSWAEDRPACIQSASPAFLAVTEYVVLDAVAQVPEALRDRPDIAMADYLAALGATPAPFPLTDDQVEACLRHIGSRWLIVKQYRTYVRRTAISAIDERPGAQMLVPPTPAVPGSARLLAQPDAAGVTLEVGSARIFCGVRTAARSLAITPADLAGLAQLVHAPHAADVLQVIDP